MSALRPFYTIQASSRYSSHTYPKAIMPKTVFTRLLRQELLESPKSVLLLGPRQTGKSTLIKSLEPDITFNLANENEFLNFARNAEEITQRLAAGAYKTVFIDEIQRLPGLLNTIQSILDDDSNDYKFYLTGSSARKLKRGQANLLPGRVFSYQLGPLVCSELDYRLDTNKALETGTLPGVYSEERAKYRTKILRSYASTYLKEEIQAEALTRNLEGFSRFLYIAAGYSGQFLDLTKLSSEARITRQSGIRFFEIVEDTLIVNRCSAFSKIDRKRLVKHPKFYFFDTGILNGLLSNFNVSADRKGLFFEHLVFNQLLSSAFANDVDIKVSTYRTSNGAEVDFIVEIERDLFAIEVKHSRNVGQSDLRGLANFGKYYQKPHRPMVLYMGDSPKVINGIPILPWQEGIKTIGF